MMDVKEESRHTLEPRFLERALATGVKLRIGEMNKTEHEGILRDAGRYEVNIEENGKIVTILKQEISFLSAPDAVLSPAAHASASQDGDASRKPNIQHEFLDKTKKKNQTLTLFLINGQRIKACIEAYD